MGHIKIMSVINIKGYLLLKYQVPRAPQNYFYNQVIKILTDGISMTANNLRWPENIVNIHTTYSLKFHNMPDIIQNTGVQMVTAHWIYKLS